jgi:hypothetical protein
VSPEHPEKLLSQGPRLGIGLETKPGAHVARDMPASAIPHTYVEVPGLGHTDIVTRDRPMETVWHF